MKFKRSFLLTVLLAFVLVILLTTRCIRLPDYTISISISFKATAKQGRYDLTTEKTFHEIALSEESYKVVYHKYQCIYEEALKPFRYRPNTRILDIGLGCSMPYGPGSSYKLWNSYFLDPTIYIFELDETCGESWYSGLPNETDEDKNRLPIMIYGDQMNRTALQEMVKAHGGWDIIVDGSSNYMGQYMRSFEELWPSVRPNGYYFIENLINSMEVFQGGTPDGLSQGERETAITMIARTFSSSIGNVGLGKIFERYMCCDQICGLRTVSKYAHARNKTTGLRYL